MYEKAEAFVTGNPPAVKMTKHGVSGPQLLADGTEQSSDEDEMGPALPGAISKVAASNKRSGPTIPSEVRSLHVSHVKASLRTG